MRSLLMVLTLLVWVGGSVISPQARAQEAYLVTYGPGPQIWAWFGHNALWLRDPEIGLDHTFSFGYFELDREGFYLDFARGHMPYFGAANLAQREFAHYRSQQRSIQVQRLALAPDEVRALHQLLQDSIEPFPQVYAYDYFFANCSTWLRDLIDQVTDGVVAEQLQAQPAQLNFIDHVRRLSGHQFWVSTGKLLLLGRLADQPRTVWDEAFLPDVLAAGLVAVEREQGPLVAEQFWIDDNPQFQAPTEPSSHVWGYLLLGGMGAALLLLGQRFGRGRWRRLPWQVMVGLLGSMGVVVTGAWLLTAHQATHANAVVLLLHPLWWLLWWPGHRPWQRALWWVLATAAAVGVVLLLWPAWPQQRLALIAWLLPWVMVVLALSPARPASPPDGPVAGLQSVAATRPPSPG
jgi:hypothetical protein